MTEPTPRTFTKDEEAVALRCRNLAEEAAKALIGADQVMRLDDWDGAAELLAQASAAAGLAAVGARLLRFTE